MSCQWHHSWLNIAWFASVPLSSSPRLPGFRSVNKNVYFGDKFAPALPLFFIFGKTEEHSRWGRFYQISRQRRRCDQAAFCSSVSENNNNNRKMKLNKLKIEEDAVLFSGEDSLCRGPHKRSTTASSESAYGHKYHSQMCTVRSERALITYAAVCKYRANLLLLHDFCAAGEILENLLTLKIKLYQRWPRNVAFGRQQLWISDSCTVFSAWYLLAVLFFFFLLKSAAQTTPTKWLLKPWQIHLQV